MPRLPPAGLTLIGALCLHCACVYVLVTSGLKEYAYGKSLQCLGAGALVTKSLTCIYRYQF